MFAADFFPGLEDGRVLPEGEVEAILQVQGLRDRVGGRRVGRPGPRIRSGKRPSGRREFWSWCRAHGSRLVWKELFESLGWTMVIVHGILLGFHRF
jgi:hypothetical protein